VSKEDTAIIGIIKRKVKVKDKEKNELIFPTSAVIEKTLV